MLERLLDFVLKLVGGRAMLAAVAILAVLALIATITGTAVSPVTWWSVFVAWVVVSIGIEGLLKLMRWRDRVAEDKLRQAVVKAGCTIWLDSLGDPEVRLPVEAVPKL